MAATYTVIWKRALIERDVADLIVLLMQAGTPVATITTAMAEIDRQLMTDPLAAGESRADYDRVLIVEPVTVYYEVYEEERIVVVRTFRYCPPRPGRE